MKKSLESGSRPTAVNWKPVIFTAVAYMVMAGNVLAAKFVSGLVPDWNQPYSYTAASPNHGPGPDPGPPNAVNQWNDWCAPTSGANLAGYWADARSIPVADATNFDHSTVLWAAGPSWQDYQADGFARPIPQGAPGPLPVPLTDIGWYMDANRGVLYDAGGGTMGGCFFGNGPHDGTYLKDIHAGLQNYLNSRYSLSGGVFWRTGTRGIGYAAGTDPTGAPAVVHANAASAFGELMSEINTNRPLILCFKYWNPVNTGVNLAPTGVNAESALGGTYYRWGTNAPNMTNTENEAWNFYTDDSALGHAVTAVGYILAGDVDDQWAAAGLPGPTNWVIVHDNWVSTARNAIIPFNYAAAWVANTTAVPWPTAARFVKGVVPDWNQPYQYNGLSPHGGPGPDLWPNVVNQWNDWCAPCSAANLVGHWNDFHCAPVADTTPFAGSTFNWRADPSWQDYLADGTIPPPGRPAQQLVPGPLPATPTDIGWYMDANRGVAYDAGGGVMGGFWFGNPLHSGTYLKDIHVGLQNYLNSRYTVGGAGWDTGTEGKAFAAGLNPSGGPAQIPFNAAAAYGEVTSEVNRNHTVILSYQHWNTAAAGTADLPLQGTNTESDWGGAYYVFGNGPGATNAEDEVWNMDIGDHGLGHAVTAVGYIPAGDVLDPGPTLQGIMAPTDWVVVHDNWASTPRNVIIPFDFLNNWVASTFAHPDPGFLQLTNIVVVGRTNAVVSLTGIPGYLHDLLYKTNLLTTGWSTAVSNVAFMAGTMRITNTVSSSDPQRFYRIKASN